MLFCVIHDKTWSHLLVRLLGRLLRTARFTRSAAIKRLLLPKLGPELVVKWFKSMS